MHEQATQLMLHPVILAVPDTILTWTGRRKVLALSRLARAAARQSARRAGGLLGRLTKNTDNVPLPSNGWHWSVAHKLILWPVWPVPPRWASISNRYSQDPAACWTRLPTLKNGV